VIGPGGKTINGIRERTGVDDITIEDDGSVFITGSNGTAEAAYAEINGMTRDYEVGERFNGEVVRLMDFGAFVQIGPGKDGLVHVSEIAPYRIDKITDAVQIGDIVPVVLKEIDEKGRYNLSIKAADPMWAQNKGVPQGTGSGRDTNHDRRDSRSERPRHRI
jgi:polyribonucleotide nucleotidyltransferase